MRKAAEIKEKKSKDCPFFRTVLVVSYSHKEEKEALMMRGYFTAGGFFGLVDGEYRLFASEADYYDAVGDDEAA